MCGGSRALHRCWEAIRAERRWPDGERRPRTVSSLTDRALALPFDQAAAELEQAVAARKIGNWRQLAALYYNAAYNAIKAGCHDRARPLLDKAFPIARELGDPLC